jgi:putative ABC transport system permease protein
VIADQDSSFLRSDQAVLFTGTVLLGLLALASVAVLVGGRLAEGTRRVGLSKAVGGTPGLVAATFLAENLFLALVAALVGLLAGWRAAPLLSRPEAELLGTPGAPPLTLVTAVVALGVALAVALASTLVRAEQVLTVLTILLVTLAALTAIFTASATVLDARRASAVTLALGATPQQVRAGLAMTQVIPALPGAILGLPLGLGLYEAAGHGLSGLPPALWLVAAVLGTVFVVAALTSVPARIGLRRPVAEMLQTEAT